GEPAEDSLRLDALVDMLQSWRRHWEEVGEIQRSLPTLPRERLNALPADPATALAQTRHLWALEFPSGVVEAFVTDLADAARAVERIRGTASPAPARRRRESVRRRLDANRLAVDVRAV